MNLLKHIGDTMNITDITSLGTEYTISDSMGEVVTSLQIIPFTSLLEASGGEYTTGSYSDYIANSIAALSGFEQVDQTKVLWFATSDKEIKITSIMEYAVTHDYNKIIIEHLADID